MTVLAVICALAAWFGGLWLDVNFNTASLSIVLPVIVMGAFILEAIRRKEN